MSHAKQELSPKQYLGHLIDISWKKTKESGTPWLNRIREHVIGAIFILLAVMASPVLSRLYLGKELFGKETLLQVLVITVVMSEGVAIFLGITFIVHLIYSPYSALMAKSMSANRPLPDKGEYEFLLKYLQECDSPYLELACGYGRLLLYITAPFP